MLTINLISYVPVHGATAVHVKCWEQKIIQGRPNQEMCACKGSPWLHQLMQQQARPAGAERDSSVTCQLTPIQCCCLNSTTTFPTRYIFARQWDSRTSTPGSYGSLSQSFLSPSLTQGSESVVDGPQSHDTRRRCLHPASCDKSERMRSPSFDKSERTRSASCDTWTNAVS